MLFLTRDLAAYTTDTTVRPKRHHEMISVLLRCSQEKSLRFQVNASTTLPGNVSPPEPTLNQASNSRRLCTFFYADLIVARHNSRTSWPGYRLAGRHRDSLIRMLTLL